MQYIGKLKTIEGPPTVVIWHWYYHLASAGFWAIVFVPLLLEKANRQWRAWMIFLPLLGTIIAVALLCRLLGSRPSTEEVMLPFVTTVVTAWAIVWLMAHRLHGQLGLRAFMSALLLMLGIGVLGYVGNVGYSSESLISLFLSFVSVALALIIPTMLAGRACRTKYSTWRFMARLLLWTPLVMSVSMLILAVGVMLYLSAKTGMRRAPIELVSVAVSTMVGAVLGLGIYVSNLGFMLLAFRNSFYNRRLRRVLGLRPKRKGHCPFAAAPANPSAENGRLT